MAKVDGYDAPFGGRGGAQLGQDRGLEFDDPVLVDLEHGGSGRPRQPVGACVETRRQDHRLADAVVGGGHEEVVEKPGADGHHVAHPHHAEVAVVVDLRRIQFAARRCG
jgi:hypothetical protein